MKPTLPAYRFRVRSRPAATHLNNNNHNNQSHSRSLFVIPATLITVLVLLAVAAPPTMPHLSLSRLRRSLSSSSSSSSTQSARQQNSNNMENESETKQQQQDNSMTTISTDSLTLGIDNNNNNNPVDTNTLLLSAASAPSNSKQQQTKLNQLQQNSPPTTTSTIAVDNNNNNNNNNNVLVEKQQLTQQQKQERPIEQQNLLARPPQQNGLQTVVGGGSTEAPPLLSASLPTRPVGRRLQATDNNNNNNNNNNNDASTTSTMTNRESSPSMSSKKSNNANNSNNNNGPKEANLAYFIQISETTVAHLPRLLARLYHARNVYVIHFDMKVDKTLVARLKRNMLKRNRKYESNVRFMPSELITYRGVSMLLNTINAMRQLLDLSSDWHYFINISGADYPMIPQVMLRQLLGRYIDDEWNFVTFAPTGTWDSNLRHRLENIYVDDALSFQSESGEVRQLDVINPIAESMRLRYTNAEAWMINSRSFCHYVINSGYARKLLLTFAYSVEASEHYFATLVWNHPIYNRTIINDAMRGVLWFFEGQSAGQHPFYVDEKKPDGKFKFETILLDIPTFFIRKFRNADSPLMDVVDKQWNNDTHLKRVREKLDWHVQVSTDEHKIKPTLSPTVMQQYSLRRRRR